MGETWTIGGLLRWSAEYLSGHGVESPRLSSELLLAESLGVERVALYLRFDQPLGPQELAAFKALLLRRKAGEPVAYILGRREFYGLSLAVGPGVLIPRPETELLVDEALAFLAGQEAPRVLDLCTGSGAVALAIAAHAPGTRVDGVDLSGEALAYAAKNAKNLGLEGRVALHEGSLYDAVAVGGGFYDLITANPPYVREEQWAGLEVQVRAFEPRAALVAGPEGLELTRQIIAGSGAFLRPGGRLLIELGLDQAEAAKAAGRAAGIFEEVHSINDLAGIPRVLVCERGDYG